MKKSWKFCVKLLLFIIILGFVLDIYYKIITPKFLNDNDWPTTSTYLGFYEMEKNSIDVLFLGSSHAAAAFNPQEIYNAYGIRSYNLSCEEQNVMISYYWLKEALRFQKPKVVVLDGLMFFDYKTQEPLNSKETSTRKAMDYMKWSNVKVEAVQKICTEDKNQSLASYYFPNIRYHSRWEDLTANDFCDRNMHNELKGFAPFTKQLGGEYAPFAVSTDSQVEMNMLMKEYLEKIVKLCNQNNIQLLLVKTPCSNESVEKYNTIKAYALEKNLLFVDMNDKETYQELDYNFNSDMSDSVHANLWGAAKISSYIGEILRTEYGVKTCEDAQWEKTKKYYNNVLCDSELGTIQDIDSYLKMLEAGQERYTIFMSVKGDATAALEESTILSLQKLGLEGVIEGMLDGSYVAIISQNEIFETVDFKRIEKHGSISNGTIPYFVTSEGYTCGNSSSIKIYNREYSQNENGLNIVIYSHERDKVIDSATFNTAVDSKRW